jgi:hypothetical protein
MWRQSVCIAAALHAGDETTIARELAAVADRGLNGLLIGEEAEYLTAFVRLAHLRGDTARARELLASTPVRSPWNIAAMAHTYAALDDWTRDDWATRVVGLVLDRTTPERIEELSETAPQALTEELERWR